MLQSRMDNSDAWATLGTIQIAKTNKAKNTTNYNDNNTETTKKKPGGEYMG